MPQWWDEALEEAVAKVRAIQDKAGAACTGFLFFCLLYTSPSPRDCS